MRLWLVVCGVLMASVASAQNSTTAVFTASPDHSVSVAGTAVLTAYDLVLAASAAPATVISTTDLGKPTPDASNQISVSIVAALSPLPSGQYIARIVARGPGGTNATPSSDPFLVFRAPAAPPAKPAIR